MLKLGRDVWTLGDAYEGVHIFGGTGSGKTSGSGKSLAHAYLKAGMGGMVLCAKPDEAELWVRYAKECGRDKSVILFRPDQGTRFNFLEYEMSIGQGGVNNVVELLLRVLDFANTNKGNGDQNEFWKQSIREMLRNTIKPLYHAYGRIDLDEVMQMINTAPRALAQFRDQQWRDSSFCFQTLKRLASNPAMPIEHREGRVISDYWQYTYAASDPKTRENIRISFTSKMALLYTGEEHKLLCTSTNIVPELTHEGAIIILDMPAQVWSDAGILIQKIMKYMWQRATLRREGGKNKRPVFLWADEAHVFVDEHDSYFQSMARSAGACGVYLSQGIEGYIDQIGGVNASHNADTLMGHFQTKIFHANSSTTTNEWASKIIGRSLQMRRGHSSGESEGSSVSRTRGRSIDENETRNSWWGLGNKTKGQDKGASSGTNYSESYNEALELELEPADFSRGLATGGAKNSFMVDGILFKTSAQYGNAKKNWQKVRFAQR